MLMNTLPQPTKFYLPVGPGYEVQLLEFVHENEQIRLKIVATPEVWNTIDMVMLFNLQWNDRNPGSVSGEEPVEIVMMLSKDLYKELKESNNLLSTSELFLKAEKEHPMKSTVNWFATEVTEEIDLPDHLQNKGSVRQGFTTKWKDDYK